MYTDAGFVRGLRGGGAEEEEEIVVGRWGAVESKVEQGENLALFYPK